MGFMAGCLNPPVVNLFLNFVDYTYYGSIPKRGICSLLEKEASPQPHLLVYMRFMFFSKMTGTIIFY